MKRRWLIYCIVLFISACSENVENKKIFISDVPTEKIRGTLYLSENASLITVFTTDYYSIFYR